MKTESCINQMTLSVAKPRWMAVILRASLTTPANVKGCLNFREIYCIVTAFGWMRLELCFLPRCACVFQGFCGLGLVSVTELC